jgi:hypothetical protein
LKSLQPSYKSTTKLPYEYLTVSCNHVLLRTTSLPRAGLYGIKCGLATRYFSTISQFANSILATRPCHTHSLSPRNLIHRHKSCNKSPKHFSFTKSKSTARYICNNSRNSINSCQTRQTPHTSNSNSPQVNQFQNLPQFYFYNTTQRLDFHINSAPKSTCLQQKLSSYPKAKGLRMKSTILPGSPKSNSFLRPITWRVISTA